MLVKIIKSYRDIVAICDSELVGRKFEEKEFQLNVKEDFFKGKELNEQEIIEVIDDMSKEDATFNVVGEKSVKAALRAGIISEDEIKRIDDIPFALVLM